MVAAIEYRCMFMGVQAFKVEMGAIDFSVHFSDLSNDPETKSPPLPFLYIAHPCAVPLHVQPCAVPLHAHTPV